jgi:uncharacterized membrane protein
MAIALLVVVQSLTGSFRPAQAQAVQAVLFFAPTCQHCHEVITQYLPGLFEQNGGAPRVSVDPTVADADRALYLFYNDQLEIFLVDASKSVGTELYLASTENQEVPPERSGVPRLVIGEVVLVGSTEIPEQTADLVRQGLEQGGLGWPSVDGLVEALTAIRARESTAVTAGEDSTAEVGEVPEDSVAAASVDSASEATNPPLAVDTVVGADVGAMEPDTPSAFEAIQTRRPSMLENFRLDPVGNSFSVVVLLAMVLSVIVVWVKSPTLPTSWEREFAIPLLAIAGAVVASYLTYVEATGATAVCGPVGDCNTVNQSEWARLFGVLPIGALGLMGYVAISLAWSASRYASGMVSTWARMSLAVMTAGGTLFSIYLTFLEPFVIGATCAWCLTSAVVITSLMWLSAGAGREAWVRIRDNSSTNG